MSLDATVYCDCFERGRLRCAPPDGVSLQVCADGSLSRVKDAGRLEDDLAFDEWRFTSACEHPDGVLLHHRLGNISLIALLRSELSREASRFPIILRKVIYDGVHGGDYMPIADISSLREEIARLASFRSRDRQSAEFIAQFETQMRELVEAAAAVQKPISF